MSFSFHYRFNPTVFGRSYEMFITPWMPSSCIVYRLLTKSYIQYDPRVMINEISFYVCVMEKLNNIFIQSNTDFGPTHCVYNIIFLMFLSYINVYVTYTMCIDGRRLNTIIIIFFFILRHYILLFTHYTPTTIRSCSKIIVTHIERWQQIQCVYVYLFVCFFFGKQR